MAGPNLEHRASPSERGPAYAARCRAGVWPNGALAPWLSGLLGRLARGDAGAGCRRFSGDRAGLTGLWPIGSIAQRARLSALVAGGGHRWIDRRAGGCSGPCRWARLGWGVGLLFGVRAFAAG